MRRGAEGTHAEQAEGDRGGRGVGDRERGPRMWQWGDGRVSATPSAVLTAVPTAVDAVLTEVAKRLDAAGTEEPGPMASAAELALELLFLTRRLAKDEGDDDTVRYG